MIDHPYVIPQNDSYDLFARSAAKRWRCFPSSCVADHYDVYLLAGQSNMDGRGLVRELSEGQAQPVDDAILFYRNEKQLKRRLANSGARLQRSAEIQRRISIAHVWSGDCFCSDDVASQPRRKLALIKGSQGGTSFRADWKPGAEGDTDSQGPQYRDFIQTIRMATELLRDRGDTFSIRGLLWHQGESDRNPATRSLQSPTEEFIASHSRRCRGYRIYQSLLAKSLITENATAFALRSRPSPMKVQRSAGFLRRNNNLGSGNTLRDEKPTALGCSVTPTQ